jgi:fido (protein-threonine AMPylation protein)
VTITKDGRGRPSRASIYAAVDQRMADLDQIGGLPGPAVAGDIWAGIWYEETHNSTAIEGNTLVLKQVRTLLDQGLAVGDQELAEYLEVRGYADAAEWVYAQASDRQTERSEDSPYITLTELREIHRLVVEPVWKVKPPDDLLPGEGPGGFRQHDVRAFGQGMSPPAFTDVPALVSDWLRLANMELDPPAVVMEQLAAVHAAFERVHPFRDGNGRTGRLALNLLLVRRGLAPAIIYKRDRDKYLRALARADRGEHGPLGELIARSVKDCLDRFLLPALGGPHQLLPLSALATKSVSALALRRAAERDALRAIRRSNGWYSTKSWVSAYANARPKRHRSAGPTTRR